jgi:hypothetical protein
LTNRAERVYFGDGGTMDHTGVEISIALGLAFVIYLGTLIVGNHLWKPPYLIGALVAAVISASLGIVLELTRVFPQKQGLALVVLMFVPLIHFIYFQMFRFVFKKWKGTEPFVAVRRSLRVGDPPTALLDPENIYRDRRKFDENRKLMWADRLFGVLQGVSPMITVFILLLLALIFDR